MRDRATTKVLLRARSGETESIWCTTVDRGASLFRVASIPILRRSPTYGDVIVATPGRDGMLAYRRLHARGDFAVTALEYATKATFRPLVAWLRATYGVISEGMVAPAGSASGVVGLAVPAPVDVKRVLAAATARYPGVWRVGERPAEASRPRPPPAPSPWSAVLAGDGRLLGRLLREGAKVDARNERGQTAALLAAERGEARMLVVLRKAGADLAARDPKGVTPLHAAAREGFTAIVRTLLAAGVRVDTRTRHFRGTPLHAAAVRDRPDVARLLLAAGARRDARDANGFTPLMEAAYRGSLRTARVLLAHGAMAPDRNEALLLAAAEGHAPIVRLLLAEGADPGYRSPRGNTALGLARKKKNASVVALLAPAPLAVR